MFNTPAHNENEAQNAPMDFALFFIPSFLILFLNALHFSVRASHLSPTLPYALINSPGKLSGADLFPLPEGNVMNSSLPYNNVTHRALPVSTYRRNRNITGLFSQCAEMR